MRAVEALGTLRALCLCLLGRMLSSWRKRTVPTRCPALRGTCRALLLGTSAGANGGPSAKGSKGQDSGARAREGGSKCWGAAGGEEEEGEGASTSGSEGEGGKQGGKGGSAQQGTKAKKKGLEVEVTFVPGFDGLSKRLEEKRKAKEAKKAETVWEAYVRRRKERLKARKVGAPCARRARGTHHVHVARLGAWSHAAAVYV